MKERPRILVLNSTNPSRLAHVRRLYQLRDRFEFTLICDARTDAGWQGKFFPRVIAADMIDTADEFPRILAELRPLGRPDGVLNLSEFCVPLQTKLCVHYGLPGPSEEAARYGRNKAQMRRLLASLGMSVPRSVNVGPATVERARELRYPVVAKPTSGGGSTMVHRCETFEEVVEFVVVTAGRALAAYGAEALAGSEDTEPLVVEELLGGDVLYPTRLPYPIGEISVESVHHEGRTQVLAIHDKPLPSNGPYFEEYVWSTPSRIPERLTRLAADYVDRIHRRLGAHVLHTEFRTFSDDLVPLEFGVRIGGACIYHTLRCSTGNDYIDILLDLCCGIAPTVRVDRRVPTIAHALWAPTDGRITHIFGEPALTRSPHYVEHELFDDIGTIARRAPLSSRANGHVIYQSEAGFEAVEGELLDALACFEIAVEPI
ncbi:ATP-grasp domain-containing protein [Sorangium sp. So ce381]|uniref:ATP-grasp domain-containing protein n=1 Tax=Sorangium sp. So ce381 TaxID=3133307 RepID=UPI003F5C6612